MAARLTRGALHRAVDHQHQQHQQHQQEQAADGNSENEAEAGLDSEGEDAAKASELLEGAKSSGSSDFISLDKLHQLRMAFELADEDGGGGLDREEFVKAFGHVLGDGLNQRQLTNLFMKIDANSDGSVDWAEFTEYMLLENKGTELMKKAEPRCEYMDPTEEEPESNSRHHHVKRITRVRFFKEIGAYATCSEDGTVRLWQSFTYLDHVRTITHQPRAPIFEASTEVTKDDSPSLKRASSALNKCPILYKGSSLKPWTVDCCYMRRANCLAVATSDRTLSFYDCALGYECIGRIRPLTSAPLHLAYYCGALSEHREVLACADDSGYVHVWHLEPGEWAFLDCDVNIDRRAERPRGVHQYFRHRVHDNRINQLEINPIIGCIVTCSSDGNVHLSDLDKRRITRTFCCHGKPVFAFVYIPRVKLVASTGADRRILFWNPYTCAVAHEVDNDEWFESPILRLCVNEKEHQMISLSTKDVVRVWDLSTFSFLEQLAHPQDTDSRFSDMLYDARNKRLVLASRSLAIKNAVMVEVAVRKSHQWPVTAALSNRNFHQLVTAASFEVHVWDIYTGMMTFRFVNPHGESNLTAMCFDVGGRRLLTGAHDGTIKIWNFNNGACLGEFSKCRNGKPLRSLSGDDDVEVASLVCFSDVVQGSGCQVSHDYIVATGRDRRVFVFSETKRDFTEFDVTFPLPQQEHLAHTDDINCVTYCGTNAVATAGDDGRILIWSLLSGFLKQRVGHSRLARLQLEPPRRKPRRKPRSAEDIRRQQQLGALKRGLDADVTKEAVVAAAAQAAAVGSANEGADGGADGGEDEDEGEEEDGAEVAAAEADDVSHVRSLRTLQRKNTILNPLMLDEVRDARNKAIKVPKAKPARQDVVPEVADMPLSAREGRARDERLRVMREQQTREEKRRRLRGVPKPDRLAVENLLYLPRLECLCSSGADGFLRFWAVDTGKQLIELDAGHDANESVVALATDDESCNKLFTGDTKGMLKVWDISELVPGKSLRSGQFKVRTESEWRAHQDGIVNLVYLEWTEEVSAPLQLLVSTCVDGSVMLWALDGSCVGMFGQEFRWCLVQGHTWQSQKSNLVRRARKIGEVMGNFNLFTAKMKIHVSAADRQWQLLQQREADAELDRTTELAILKTRVRNKFKLSYLADIEKKQEEAPPLSAAQALLQILSKQKRKPKPSEMPSRPSLQQLMREQQVMHRVSLPELSDVSGQAERIARTASEARLR